MTSIKLSDDAKASLVAALLKKDNDLAASSHASAKSRRSNFSSSTGNDTNCSLNTSKFALTHKTRALELANERKKSADLIASQRAMAQRIQELEEMFAASTSPAKTSRPPRRSIRIAGQTSKDPGAAHESVQGTIVCVNNDSSEEAEFEDDNDVTPPTNGVAIAASSPSDPSKTSPKATDAGNGQVLDGGK